jgi:hypothetical protein
VSALIGVNLGRALGWFDALRTVPKEELVELMGAILDRQPQVQPGPDAEAT